MQIKGIPLRSLAALVLLTLISGCDSRNDELAQTLEWMYNTYNPREGISSAVGHGRTGWYVLSQDRMTEKMVSGDTETFSHNGCQFTLHMQENPAASAHLYDSQTFTFNLRDIDPHSIKIGTYSHFGGFRCEGASPLIAQNCDHAEITFSTHNEAPIIDNEFHKVYPELKGSDHESSSMSKATGAYFEVDDVEYATRLANAFRHAVELCGGKPSNF